MDTNEVHSSRLAKEHK